MKKSLGATQMSLRKHADKMEAAYVLPGGTSILEATQSQTRDRQKHLFLAIQNKVVIEPIVKESPKAPIDWNSARS